jgi:hypothetical protein
MPTFRTDTTKRRNASRIKLRRLFALAATACALTSFAIPRASAVITIGDPKLPLVAMPEPEDEDWCTTSTPGRHRLFISSSVPVYRQGSTTKPVVRANVQKCWGWIDPDYPGVSVRDMTLADNVQLQIVAPVPMAVPVTLWPLNGPKIHRVLVEGFWDTVAPGNYLVMATFPGSEYVEPVYVTQTVLAPLRLLAPSAKVTWQLLRPWRP